MKKIIISLLFILLIVAKSNAQDFIGDSIKTVIATAKSDSAKASAMLDLATHAFNNLQNFDTALQIVKSTLEFVREKGLAKKEVETLSILAWLKYWYYPDENEANQLNLQALAVARKHHFIEEEIGRLLDLSSHLRNNPDSAELLIDQALILSVQHNLVERQISALARKGEFNATAKPDSAKLYLNQALAIARQLQLPKSEVSFLQKMAYTYNRIHWGDSAYYLMHEALMVARKNNLAEKELYLLGQHLNIQSEFFLKDSVSNYYERMLLLCRQLNKDSLNTMMDFGSANQTLGNFPIALNIYLQVLHAYEERKDNLQIGKTLRIIGEMYEAAKDYHKSIEYCRQALKYTKKDDWNYPASLDIMAIAFSQLQQNDSARYYAEKTIAMFGLKLPHYASGDIGTVYFRIGEDSLAYFYLSQCYNELSQNINDPYNYVVATLGLASYFRKTDMADSSLYYATLCFNMARAKGNLKYISESSEFIAEYYIEKINTDSAYHYQQIGFDAYKTLYGEENSRQLQNMAFAEQQREQEVTRAKKMAEDKYRSRLNIYMLIGGLLILSILAYGLWRRNIFRQKSFAQLQKQKEEIDLQKEKLEVSFNELKATQQQLIASEKLAAFGSVASRMAHEIQNPLNFVNNFSELSHDLISDVAGAKTEEEKSEALNTLKENLIKINQHGKRASSIVKQLQEHSNKGTAHEFFENEDAS